MNRVSVWSPRGGSGKTTIAISLAGALADRGSRVILVDADPQGATLLWARLGFDAERETCFVVSAGVPRRREDYDFIIYDHAPGARKALPPGDIVLLPTLTDAASVLTMERVRPELRQRGKRTLVVANRWRPDRREHHRVRALLDVPVLRDRAVYATAYGRGATVFDAAGLLHVAQAKAEIEALAERVICLGEGR